MVRNSKFRSRSRTVVTTLEITGLPAAAVIVAASGERAFVKPELWTLSPMRYLNPERGANSPIRCRMPLMVPLRHCLEKCVYDP